MFNVFQHAHKDHLDLPCIVELSLIIAVSLNLLYLSGEITALEIETIRQKHELCSFPYMEFLTRFECLVMLSNTE